MRAVASGVSAGGSLAILHHLLSAVEPRFDPGTCAAFSNSSDRFHWGSFIAGLCCGIAIYAVIEFLVTVRWAFIQFVTAYTVGTGCGEAEGRKKPLYKILS